MKTDIRDIEKTLLQGLKKGDQLYFKILFDEHYAWLCNYVYKLCQDQALSEDLVQNVFLRIWEKRATLNVNTSFKNYLFRSCHNEFLMHVRKKKQEIATLDALKWETLFEIHHPSQEENVSEQNWVKLEAAIERLPEKCKEVFKLSRLQQKKHKEIAQIMGISTKTVEVHITKALRFLKANATSFLSLLLFGLI